jgi:hypothetical protein
VAHVTCVTSSRPPSPPSRPGEAMDGALVAGARRGLLLQERPRDVEPSSAAPRAYRCMSLHDLVYPTSLLPK